ncbi:MAG TPA: DUF5082 domain-containing protein [Clostridiaceae bacterium]|nr:DUF5082 domain-containing protein [Clostridiaceae bacterium]
MSANWNDYYNAVNRCYAQQSHNSRMRSQISSCRRQIGELEEKISRLRTAKTNASSDKDAFSSGMSKANQAIDTGRFKGEHQNNVQTCFDAVKTAVGTHVGNTFTNSVINPINTKITELQNKISSLRSQISSCQSQIVYITWPTPPAE